MKKRVVEVRRLGRVEYERALRLQKELEQAVIERSQTDVLLLLEHPHTYTLGRRGKPEGILATPELLASLGVTTFETNRGGKITYHGIGQIIGYPILNLSPDREDVHLYVRNIEEVLMRTLADFDIESFRITGLTGVHTKMGKVAAIGVHLKRWTTTHGFALNVNTDLKFFDYIIACDGEPVTSMEKILGAEIPFRLVEDKIIENFTEVFDSEVSADYESQSGLSNASAEFFESNKRY